MQQVVSAGKPTKQARRREARRGRMPRGRRHSVSKVTSEQRPGGTKPENAHSERLFQAMALRWAEVGSVKSEEWQGS